MKYLTAPRHASRRLICKSLVLVSLLLTLLLAACSPGQPKLTWKLNASVKGHLPDLRFQLTNDDGQAVTAKDYQGTVNLLYFGYTNCPDVCPLTLAHLNQVMRNLGPLASHARILFVSVDPARDTPEVLHRYVRAFGPRTVGLSGSESQLRSLAKRYRVAYSRGPGNAQGGYEVNHSSAVYIFDEQDHIRLLATPLDTVPAITHDVRQLIRNAPSAP